MTTEEQIRQNIFDMKSTAIRKPCSDRPLPSLQHPSSLRETCKALYYFSSVCKGRLCFDIFMFMLQPSLCIYSVSVVLSEPILLQKAQN